MPQTSDLMHKHTNKLIDETSPYLLQHAHNPVDWFPWGEEALQKARTENKPILVSIGYSACHWCHVMEKESFEDEATAAIMNMHFINIKIDREERPDLDHIYMDAVQAMTGSGGWPLNVFLTPAGKPFYGGTYFPPRKAFNRASWQEVLQMVLQAFNERRHEIDAQSENLTAHISQSNSFGKGQTTDAADLFNPQQQDEVFDNIMKAADKEWGGFGQAPKFPQTFIIQYLLRYHYTAKIKLSDSAGLITPSTRASNKLPPLEEALQQAMLSLNKMIEGGIYDQLGGGFSRYSTDAEWLAPHFEKMLYDNALLVTVLSEAYQLTGTERYREVIEETMTFVERELLHPHKGFYAALDADSEGEEGKFYVWGKLEIENHLAEDAPLFCRYYDITNQGNWEGENILRVQQPVEQFAADNDIPVKELRALLDRGRKELMRLRDQRVRPLLDDKIILGWNALMNSACSKAFGATGNDKYRQLATDNMNFLLEKFKTAQPGEFYHTWKNEKAKYPAFLDDYAFLIRALLQLAEISADTKWLEEAKTITGHVLLHFSEPGTGFFYFTTDSQEDVIVRKKEVFDGAIPSGNAVMAFNLYHLGLLFDISEWKQRAYEMVNALGKAIIRYPTSFGVWNNLLMEMTNGTLEIAIVGKNAVELHGGLLREFIPFRILMASTSPTNTFPLLKDKLAPDPAFIYLCKNFACLKPVNTIFELMSLINNGTRNI